MNKYSSKAIKTAATVGMSLAMVLSAVPAVGNATVAQAAVDDIVTVKSTTEMAHDIVSAVLDALEGDYTEAYADTKLLKVAVSVDSKDVFAEADTDLKGLGDLAVAAGFDSSGIAAGDTFEAIATFLANNVSSMDESDVDSDVVDFAKFIKGYAKATTAGKLGDYFTGGDLNKEKNKGAVITAVATDGVTKDTAKDAEAIYKVIKDNEKYLNAMISVDKRDTVTDTVNNFLSEVEDYKAEREDVYVTDYANELEKVELIAKSGDVPAITLYEAVVKGESISYKNLSKLEKVLKDIKNDDNDKLKAIAKYDDVKDAEEVAEYIEGLETIIEEMKEVKDLLKSTNSDVKAYKKDLATKVKKLAKAVEAYLNDSDDGNADKEQEALDAALNAFREADATALKNFVEDYIGSFFALTPKQLNSGKYVVRLENADYGRYVSNADVFNLLETNSATEGLQYLLTTVIDNEESADTYYDTIVNTVTTVEELLKAVTTDIEGLTLSSTLTDKQAAKVIAARKALNQLVDDNGKITTEYTSALTSKEKKEVLANVELIEALYFKLIMNGTVTASGWINKGNGEWDYIAEDGSRPTKWVASGANWYYVKNGTMLRNSWIASDAQGTRWYYVDDAGVMVSNTTVNGYTFNSYGVWVK